MGFSDDFVWGAAAASYQIEGAATEAGKGLSIWDMTCRQRGRIWNGHNGNIACDHYYRYQQDVRLMQQMGLQAYRLSVSWPRILPAGTGKVNAKGLAFYDALIDALLAAHITPYVTLFHWDFPYELYCRGGWLNRDSAAWFAEYTQVVVDALSDRVQHWITLNEPQCYIGLGLLEGMHAPGDKLGLSEVLRAGHHTLLAHGRAVQVIRARARTSCQVGYAPTGSVLLPASHTAEDIEAARRGMFAVDKKNCWNIAWWSDPVIWGVYPEDGCRLYGNDAPQPAAGDMETICQPLDFYGTNIYNGYTVEAGRGKKPKTLKRPPGYAMAANKWPITPAALYWGPKFYYERYGLPILVVENGLSNQDWVAMDGRVHDPQRIDFMQRYLLAYRQAADDGVMLKGYFHWSVMDNFEWAEGYKERFGLVYIDFETQERVLKDSAYWYRDLIASNGTLLDS